MPEQAENLQPSPEPAAPPSATPPAIPPVAVVTQQDGRVVHMPTHAVGRLKKEAAEKGRKAALQELATQWGYSSVEEMLLQQPKLREAAAQPKPAATPRPAQPPRAQANGANAGNGDAKRLQRDLDRLQREKDEIARRMKREASGRKQLQRELDARDAEMVLREAAVAAGLKDIDYGVRLLSRHLDGKSEDELKSFDEAAYFQGLKSTHPYLFGERTVPANTGAGGSGAPPAPKPGEVSQVHAQSGQLDVRKMTPQEFAAHVRSQGLQLPVA